MIGWLLNTSLGRTIAAAGAILIAVLAGLRMHRRAVLAEAAARADRDTLETMERMRRAPDLRNASDADRVNWLRDFASRHGVD
jgi:hypothetical protein